MKMRLLFLSLLLLCINVFGDEKESDIEREMREAGFIVIIDLESKPTEVQIESEGKTIVCFSRESEQRKAYVVHKNMFPAGQFSVLMLCTRGVLFVKNGYV